MPYIGKKPADIIATAVDTTTGTFSGDLTVDTSTLYVDSANNRVGVGTASPNEKLTVSSGAISFLGDISTPSIGAGLFRPANNTLAVVTGSTERMRIDTSGNLLVGKTNTSFSNAGVRILPTGNIYPVADGSVPLEINRLSSDGDIVKIYKDGTTVGSIGSLVSGRDLHVNSTGGILTLESNFNSTERQVVLGDTYFGVVANDDNAVDLGRSSARYKDLYLSNSAQLANITNGAGEKIILNSDNIAFQVQASEAMRIDSSGNLLVGKTASAFGTGGIEIRGSDDASYFTRSGNAPVHINRLTSDGEIVRFNKDSSLVGSIGSLSGFTYLGSGDTGMLFVSSDETIRPHNTTTNVARDNAISLGEATVRWKDLYLSGNAGVGANPSSFNAGANNLVVGTGSGSEGISIYAGNSSNSAIFFADTDSTTTGQINYQHASNAFTFHTNGGTERMRIDSSGKVGILTTSPSTYLEIARDGQAAAISGTYHKDMFASMLVTGAEPRIQIAGSDNGSDSAMLLLSSGTNNWAVRANGPSGGNRFSIGYYSSGSDGNIGSYSTLTKSLEIETNGAVTLPKQPAFSAKVTSQQSNIAPSSQVTVLFATELYDQNSDYNNSTYTFTAPVTGKYQLNVLLLLDNLDTGPGYYQTQLRTSNRVYYHTHDPRGYSQDLAYNNLDVSILADMDAGDTAYVTMYQAGGVQQTDIDAESYFTGHLVC